MVGAAVLSLVLSVAVIGPWIQGHDPNATGPIQFAAPGSEHWFGTDIHGRDVLARVLAGLRLSALIGAAGAAVSLLIGVGWGMVAAYVGGRLDGWMMRTIDVLYALPNIVFVMLVITMTETHVTRWLTGFAPGWVPATRLAMLTVCLGAVSWLTMARIIRGQVLGLRNRPFVLASQALGAGGRWILLRHILPNLSGVIIAYVSLTVPAVVLQESFLSFLGLGIRPPQASLGTLIADGAGQLNPVIIRWWLLVFPGGALAVVLLALQFVGDGLRDAFDPQSDR
jgi:oligopeptide transport system permease protein